MAVKSATRLAVATRRGHFTMGLAQSRGEACRWMEDAIRWATSAFEAARASAPEYGPSLVAPTAELPALISS